MMRKYTIAINGTEMVYEECGEGNSQTIVLLHGFCGSPYYWHEVCPLLIGKYRIIMPQLRGHGSASVLDDDYSIEALADDIYQLIETLNIDKIVIFGHSLGGYVALAFAEKYQHKLLGLGLIHSTALPDTEEKKEKRRQDIDRISAQGTEKYIKELIPNLFAASKQTKLQAEIATLINIGLQMNEEVMKGIIEGMRSRPNRSHVLADASYPILLVAGAEDQVISPLETFSVAPGELADSTFRYPHILETTFENVAHMSLIEVPNQLSRVMNNYLKILHEKKALRS